MATAGNPKDLDDEALRRIAHSFYVVKMARYAALLVATLCVAALAGAEDAPAGVTVGLVVLAAAFAGVMVATALRYRRQAGSSPRS